MKRFSFLFGAIATLLFSTAAFATDDGNFAIGIANSLPITDTIITLSNSGSSWGQPFPGLSQSTSTTFSFSGTPIAGTPVAYTGSGQLCANVYVFSPDEELQECCTCPMSPNSIHSYSVIKDLLTNPLTGPPYQFNSAVIKIVATENIVGCNAALAGSTISSGPTPPLAAYPLAGGLLAWQRRDNTAEVPFISASLSSGELKRATMLCGFNQQNGSFHGICKGCTLGGQ